MKNHKTSFISYSVAQTSFHTLYASHPFSLIKLHPR